ncbi:MAG: HEAT repeat domain-containing protein [Acidimicrobiia bacterium]
MPAKIQKQTPRPFVLSRTAASLGVRPGEGRMVGSVAALFIITQASQGLGANAADALFFLRFGVEFLPIMILLSGPILMVATVAYSGGLGRVGASRSLTPVLAGLAVMLSLERIGITAAVPGIYAMIWLGSQVAILISYTVMWNAATETCTTRQAKRLFPLFASAGIGGGIGGNAATGFLARSLGTENLLLVQAGLLVAASVITTAYVRRYFKAEEPGPRATIIGDLRAGLRVTRETPLLRLVTWAAVAFSILFFLVGFPFSEVVAASFPTEVEVASFLGLFSAIATAATFAVSLFATNRLFARIGVVATLLIQPIVYAAGFGLWLVSFGLVTATIVRGLQWVAVNALGGTAWTALFNVLPGRRRSQVMAFMSGIPMQLGTMASGILLLIGTALPQDLRIVIGLVVAVVSIAVVARMRTTYTQALVGAVQQGIVVVLDAPIRGPQQQVLDAELLSALSMCLDDQRPGARAMAASLLGKLAPDRASEAIATALSDNEPRVRRAALTGLADHPDSARFAAQALGDPAPEVRRSAIGILVKNGSGLADSSANPLVDLDPNVRSMAATLVEPHLGARVIDELLASDDPVSLLAGLTALSIKPGLATIDPVVFTAHDDRRVRAAAARCLVGRTDIITRLREMLDDPSVPVRTAAAETLAATPETSTALIEVLATGSVRACDAALPALAKTALHRDALNQWIAGEVDRARYLRFHRTAITEHPASTSRAYLRRLLLMRQQHLERWALVALSVPEVEPAMPVVRRGVWSDDPEVRAQAIEALDSFAPRQRVAGLIALLEGDAAGEASNSKASLRVLASDFDKWIRGLATRVLMEELDNDNDHFQSAKESSGLAVSRWASPQVQDTHTLDAMDRVLAIQQVHMFSEIDPEDLERIAAICTERRYEPDEVIYSIGGQGDEMLVMVSGTVEVRRQDHSLIRNFGPGDHVGELSLLKRGTRSANVIAGPEGVHALALTAPEFTAILEERPEVALAMLATLAERLGSM